VVRVYWRTLSDSLLIRRSIEAVLDDVRRNASILGACAREIEERAYDANPLAPTHPADDTRGMDSEREDCADPPGPAPALAGSVWSSWSSDWLI
jgi:hypothetical protein